MNLFYRESIPIDSLLTSTFKPTLLPSLLKDRSKSNVICTICKNIPIKPILECFKCDALACSQCFKNRGNE